MITIMRDPLDRGLTAIVFEWGVVIKWHGGGFTMAAGRGEGSYGWWVTNIKPPYIIAQVKP